MECEIPEIRRSHPHASIVWIGFGAGTRGFQLEAKPFNARSPNFIDEGGNQPGKDGFPLENEPGGEKSLNTKNAGIIAGLLNIKSSTEAFKFLCESMAYRMNLMVSKGEISQGVFIHIPEAPNPLRSTKILNDTVIKVVGPAADPDSDGIPNSRDSDPFNRSKK